MKINAVALSVCLIGMGLNAQTAAPNTAQIRRDFGTIPIYFEENRGQTDARARYVARGGNLVAFVTEEGWTSSPNGALVSMRIVGADRKAQFAAEGVIEGVSNYYLGHRAIAGLKHYASVRVAMCDRGSMSSITEAGASWSTIS